MKSNPLTWFSDEGASPDVLRELEAEVGPLPAAYLDLLRRSNGGEVRLSVLPLALCLDSAEAALDYWRSGTYTLSGVFVFGSNGGLEMIAFDLRTPGRWPVVFYDPIDPEGSIQQLADDFDGLLTLAREP